MAQSTIVPEGVRTACSTTCGVRRGKHMHFVHTAGSQNRPFFMHMQRLPVIRSHGVFSQPHPRTRVFARRFIGKGHDARGGARLRRRLCVAVFMGIRSRLCVFERGLQISSTKMPWLRSSSHMVLMTVITLVRCVDRSDSVRMVFCTET